MIPICVTKEFSFDMAHALANYDGECRHIHGHTYFLSVTVVGQPVQAAYDPHEGLVIDFNVLKNVVKREIIDLFDHALVLSASDSRKEALSKESKLVITPYRPTCENLLIDFVSRLERYFVGSVKLHSVMLRETPTSYATWSAALSQ